MDKIFYSPPADAIQTKTFTFPTLDLKVSQTEYNNQNNALSNLDNNHNNNDNDDDNHNENGSKRPHPFNVQFRSKSPNNIKDIIPGQTIFPNSDNFDSCCYCFQECNIEGIVGLLQKFGWYFIVLICLYSITIAISSAIINNQIYQFLLANSVECECIDEYVNDHTIFKEMKIRKKIYMFCICKSILFFFGV